MYETCPKCGYTQQPEDVSNSTTCPACGIIYAKWLKQQFRTESGEQAETDHADEEGFFARVLARLLATESRVEPVYFYCRLVVFGVFFLWGWHFILLDYSVDPYSIGKSFMHNINLVFHEAGHVLFRPFGWFMTILGGSLFQLMMPLIVLLTLIIKNNDTFGASIALWWFGQSFIDLAPYIDDALEQKLVLLGGRTGADAPGNHDWNNLLGELNRLEKCHDYAATVDFLGCFLILLSFTWGGYLLYRQYENLK